MPSPPQRRSFDDTVSQSLKSLISNISHNESDDNEGNLHLSIPIQEEDDDVRVTVSSPPVIMMQPDGSTVPVSSRLAATSDQAQPTQEQEQEQATHGHGRGRGRDERDGRDRQGDNALDFLSSEHPLISTDSVDFVSVEDIERNLGRLENGSLFSDPSSDENSLFSTTHNAAEKMTFSSTREMVMQERQRLHHVRGQSGVGQGGMHSQDSVRALTSGGGGTGYGGSTSSSQVVYFSPLHMLHSTGRKKAPCHVLV